jgi:ABC-type uncharacterized transport system substrate-binding protein
LSPKRLELLRQLVPKAMTIALLVRPNTPETEAERRDVLAAAKAIGQPLMTFDASTEQDIESATRRPFASEWSLDGAPLAFALVIVAHSPGGL